MGECEKHQRLICAACGRELTCKKNGVSVHFGKSIVYDSDLWECGSCGIRVARTAPAYQETDNPFRTELDIEMRVGRSDGKDTDPKEARRQEKLDYVQEQLKANECSALMLGTTEDQILYADAILGVIGEGKHMRVLYSGSKVVVALMEMMTCSYEKAMEWYSFNTIRSIQYMKPEDNPPVLVDNPIC